MFDRLPIDLRVAFGRALPSEVLLHGGAHAQRPACPGRSLFEAPAHVRRHGFAVMTGTPTEPGTLCKVAELFGYVRETNYGRFFEVRAEAR